MARTRFILQPLILLLITIALSLSVDKIRAKKLSSRYYSSTCPKAESVVRKGIFEAVKKDLRMGASLLRLNFHDCFVQGCDASLLLDDNSTFTGEKTAGPNNGSTRGFEVIDLIKAELEKACPKVVSCADILAIAARDSVVYLGGPSWTVLLGRRDSVTANFSATYASLPAPTFNLSALNLSFAVQGLSFEDMVTLSGVHTIGVARCTSFMPRIYNDTNIDQHFARQLRMKCSKSGNDKWLQGLDLQTKFKFDNKYYQNTMFKKGLLHSDQELFNGNSADSLTKKYASDQSSWFDNFARSMAKMGNIKPLTGTEGEIRVNCRRSN